MIGKVGGEQGVQDGNGEVSDHEIKNPRHKEEDLSLQKHPLNTQTQSLQKRKRTRGEELGWQMDLSTFMVLTLKPCKYFT